MSQTQNPFFNRQRITQPGYFFGRDREIEALYSAIITHQSRSLVGERKIGKSSLLTHIARPQTAQGHGLDPERMLFLYIDLEGMSNMRRDEFWPELLDRIEMALPNGRLKEMAADMAMQPEIRFGHMRRLLRRVRREELEVVLMLDEFESLANNSEFEPAFYGELRSLAGELGVVFLTASKRSLYDLTYHHTDTLSSPFFNIFSEVPLSLLDEDEAVALLAGVSAAGGASFDDEQIAFALELAGPHPFFLQIAGTHVYEALQSEQGLDEAQRRFAAEAEDHYRYLWSQLTDDTQAALLALNAASTRAVKNLRAKNLVYEAGGGAVLPFGKGFGEFVKRQKASSETGTYKSYGDLTGRTLGNYRIIRPIGRGGMATVYQGYQPSLDRYVAIKVLAPNLGGDEEFMTRFKREASGVAQLRHQHLVQMVDFGAQGELTYMVMEYIAGETLKQRLINAKTNTKPLDLPEIAQVLRGVAEALDYAHAYAVVHRDVKPANIMLRPEERLAELTGAAPFTAVLTDFGVARMLEGVDFTQTGMTLGTPDYMSPEQVKGEPVGPPADIYALGIVLWEMLTLELPFQGDTPMAVLLKRVKERPPSVLMKVPELPDSVEPVLQQALATEPADRFRTASEFSRAFDSALGVAS